MDIDFDLDGDHYIAQYTNPNPGVTSSVGCHSTIVTGIGAAVFQRLYRIRAGIKEEVTIKYTPWGTTSESGNQIIEKRFKETPKELKDLIYAKVATAYFGVGVVIFSDHVNAGTAVKSTGSVLILGEAYGPAAFAKWLHEHRKDYGPVYATPVFGNPNHKSDQHYSLVQVFTWIPKPNEWTIASDMSLIPCPRDPEFTKQKMIVEACKRSFPGRPPERVDNDLKVTYA